MTAGPCPDPEHLPPPRGTAEGPRKHITRFKATTTEPETTNTASVTTRHLIEVMERKLSELASTFHPQAWASFWRAWIFLIRLQLHLNASTVHLYQLSPVIFEFQLMSFGLLKRHSMLWLQDKKAPCQFSPYCFSWPRDQWVKTSQFYKMPPGTFSLTWCSPSPPVILAHRWHRGRWRDCAPPACTDSELCPVAPLRGTQNVGPTAPQLCQHSADPTKTP